MIYLPFSLVNLTIPDDISPEEFVLQVAKFFHAWSQLIERREIPGEPRPPELVEMHVKLREVASQLMDKIHRCRQKQQTP